MAAPTPQQIADFLGRGDDAGLVALAETHLPLVTSMAYAYTRGGGFDVKIPNDEVEAVIVTATARLLANPEQLRVQVGGVQVNDGFAGWNLAETFVLNRYRKRAL